MNSALASINETSPTDDISTTYLTPNDFKKEDIRRNISIELKLVNVPIEAKL